MQGSWLRTYRSPWKPLTSAVTLPPWLQCYVLTKSEVTCTGRATPHTEINISVISLIFFFSCLLQIKVLLFSWVPVARVFHRLLRWDVHVGRQRLVHKCTKAHPQVAGGAAHRRCQAVAERPQAEEVIVHGEGEIHQVVEVHRIIFHLTDLHGKALSIIWGMSLDSDGFLR